MRMPRHLIDAKKSYIHLGSQVSKSALIVLAYPKPVLLSIFSTPCWHPHSPIYLPVKKPEEGPFLSTVLPLHPRSTIWTNSLSSSLLPRPPAPGPLAITGHDSARPSLLPKAHLMWDVHHLLAFSTYCHTQGFLRIYVVRVGGGSEGSHVRSRYSLPWPEKGTTGPLFLPHSMCCGNPHFLPAMELGHSLPPQEWAARLFQGLAQQRKNSALKPLWFSQQHCFWNSSQTCVSSPPLGSNMCWCVWELVCMRGWVCACTRVGACSRVCVCSLLQYALEVPVVPQTAYHNGSSWMHNPFRSWWIQCLHLVGIFISP